MITGKELAVLALIKLSNEGKNEAVLKLALGAIANPHILLSTSSVDEEIKTALAYCAGHPSTRYLCNNTFNPTDQYFTFSQVIDISSEQHEKNRIEFNLLNRVQWIR